ncbi:MAG: radical SAM family heme chaperone HemW [Acidobacteria bacterium]|nr:radical SAM family heme chaperone HemW [Acidobacteriota bacterium]
MRGVYGVYIAVPFCAQKCTYCNFASSVLPRALLDEYLAALETELAAEGWAEPPDTLYLGGGTPSLLEEAALRGIVERLPRVEWSEATIEVSPGTVTADRAALWKELGFDRVSLGVQSFVAREIAATGRKHSARQVEEEVGALRGAGFSKINIDLIAGLPYQSRESWRESLDWVERISPPHVSAYMLEEDEDSRLGREILSGGSRYGARAVPDEEQIAEYYLEAVARLECLGLRRYEISNFARPGFESRHNLKYWRREPYRGFGADAHSFDGRRRWWNVETAAEYVERFRGGRSPVESSGELSPRQSMEEHFFVGLRQAEGIEPAEEEWETFAEPIRRLADDGLLERGGGRLRLTDRGTMVSNLVFQEFIN